MKLLFVISALFVLSSCQDVAETGDAVGVGSGALTLEAQAQACLAKDGRFGEVGNIGLFTCFVPTGDAEKRCSASTDCEGLCLARSGTCAPVTPMLGCHDVLGSLGGRSTLCTQ
ncbi:MAG: hypothetical protein V3U96_09595 [Paracoccaceae bacterium]